MANKGQRNEAPAQTRLFDPEQEDTEGKGVYREVGPNTMARVQHQVDAVYAAFAETKRAKAALAVALTKLYGARLPQGYVAEGSYRRGFKVHFYRPETEVTSKAATNRGDMVDID